MEGHFDKTAVARLGEIRKRISQARAKSKRNDDICLVAVSKTFAPEVIEPVLQAGQRVFGENRIQEAVAKWPALKERYRDVKLHLIGPLQTNKTELAIRHFDCIETVDREKLVKALVRQADRLGRLPRLFIQVNTGCEPQKSGILPGDADKFIKLCRTTYGLEIDGVMCIPPVREEPALHFALLAKIAHRNGIKKISMGMSADFEKAIELGATHVRVGSAIFGTRD